MSLLLLLLSHFSRVRLCATPLTEPTRLPLPRDSPGKNTGVGCHFLLQHMKVKNESEVAQSCPILWDPMVCSPPGSSVHGISQARAMEWGATAFSKSLCYTAAINTVNHKAGTHIATVIDWGWRSLCAPHPPHSWLHLRRSWFGDDRFLVL